MRISPFAGLLLLLPAGAAAQTGYYNTDVGRPIRVEDAYAVERYALDLHLAPLRLERGDGVTAGLVTPEATYGLVPRTQVELGVPILYRDPGDGRERAGVAGIELTALYNINAETRTLPAFGVRAGVLMPVGPLAPERMLPSFKGIVTRSLWGARLHLNVQYTFGDEPDDAAADRTAALAGLGVSRWLTGAAIDRAFAFRSLLVTAEAFAAQPLVDTADVQWNAGAGLRYQLTSTITVDAGIGRRLTGADQAWYVTLGLARIVSTRAIFPGRGAWGGP